jgi:hypothetical protein
MRLAPLLFSKLLFLFSKIDAGIVEWSISQLIEGGSLSGYRRQSVDAGATLTAACASFCWVMLTMLRGSLDIRTKPHTRSAGIVYGTTFYCMGRFASGAERTLARKPDRYHGGLQTKAGLVTETLQFNLDDGVDHSFLGNGGLSTRRV